MRARPVVPFVLVGLAGLVALSGCTGGDATPGPTTAASASEAPRSASGGGSARATAGEVVAEQTFDAGASDAGDGNPGGSVTATVRSLEVSGRTMVLRWAMRWDNDDAPDDAVASLLDLGIGTSPRMTDTENLKQYLPLCTEGSWQGGVIGSTECANSQLVSPTERVFTKLPNHRDLEAWAVFAAPEDDDVSFEVVLNDGWPTFADVTPTDAP